MRAIDQISYGSEIVDSEDAEQRRSALDHRIIGKLADKGLLIPPDNVVPMIGHDGRMRWPPTWRSGTDQG